MARYKILEPTFLRERGFLSPKRYDRGAIVEFDGIPGFSLKPLDDEAREASAAAEKPFTIARNKGQARRYRE